MRYLELKTLFKEKEVISVVVDGSTLDLIFTDQVVTTQFFELCRASKSVVCCRVSPKQKSDIVEHYMKSEKGICIAVGDGANDVPMIMQAHIGVGIRGKEGTQAVRSSDFAINEFQSMKKLLLFHGRLGYKRIAWQILYYFYKNIVLALSEIYFPLYNGFSGQIFFPDWLPMLYNSVFTSYACSFAYALEQDADAEHSYQYPVLYEAGQKKWYFNLKTFWKWIIFSVWHATCAYYGPSWFGMGMTGPTGHTQGHWFNSTASFTIIVHFVTLKLFVDTFFWNWLTVVAAVLSVGAYYFVLFFLSVDSIMFIQKEITGMMWLCASSPKFWFMQIGFPIICLLPDLILNIVQQIYFPHPGQIIMAEKKGWRKKINE